MKDVCDRSGLAGTGGGFHERSGNSSSESSVRASFKDIERLKVVVTDGLGDGDLRAATVFKGEDIALG